MNYLTDREWSDRWIPTIKRIVGPHLLGVAPKEMDQKENTDLVVLLARDMRIAARVRRIGWAEKKPFDFTIRSRRSNGAATEHEKILAGFGDWFFYGHEHIKDDFSVIHHWWLIDLNIFRFEVPMFVNIPGDIANGDGKTFFKAYNVHDFDRSLLISSSSGLRRDQSCRPNNVASSQGRT